MINYIILAVIVVSMFVVFVWKINKTIGKIEQISKQLDAREQALDKLLNSVNSSEEKRHEDFSTALEVLNLIRKNTNSKPKKDNKQQKPFVKKQA